MAIANDTLPALYRLMLVTRQIDKTLGAHDGHWHGLEGEEATVAGVYYGLRPGDVVAPHYRGSLTAAYAKGADLRRLFAGCLDRATGYSGGRARADICGPAEFKIIGLFSGSLGPPLAYALGGALAAKLDGRDDIAVGVFGDGTSSRGDCHETMNMAAAMKLPMVFVCENNQYAISTAAEAGVAGEIWKRAAGYGMPGLRVDGNDLLAVRGAMEEAVARARAGLGPTLIECLTYRVAGHFYSDTEDYRDQEVVDAWRARDPIARTSAYLRDQGILSEAEQAALFEDVRAEVETAFATAMDDPAPGPEALGLDRVYA